MKLICSKCKTPVKSEFDELCHKCGHIFKSIRRHIVSKPHKYHIVRDIIIVLLILLLVYWAYNIHQSSQQEVVVTPPDVKVPEVTVTVPEIRIPEQEIVVNPTVIDPFDKNKPFVKSTTVERFAELKKKERV